MKPRILILIDHYLPGFKSGGPVRSVSKIVEKLASDYDFYILTRNRDYTESEPYAGIAAESWVLKNAAKVFYAERVTLSLVRRVLNEINPDVVYANSYFSRFVLRYLALRRVGLVSRTTPVVLAPRGEFSLGALRIKRLRKSVFIAFAEAVRLYSDLIWHASAELEAQDIRRILPRSDIHVARIMVASDFPSVSLDTVSQQQGTPKKKGEAWFVFLSRISPKKNLAFALKLLRNIRGKAKFTIFGPIDDAAYWAQCQKIIQSLPTNVAVEYGGSIPHDAVLRTFSSHQFMLFPTAGENFGHVILEAFLGGCPVLLSDQTPWRDLANDGAGWDIPLANVERWRSVVQECVDMDGAMYEALRNRTRAYGVAQAGSPRFEQENRQLFEYAVARSPRRAGKVLSGQLLCTVNEVEEEEESGLK
ncbi:MAG TPA: glycosyltransferase [Terriglobales bacterium]|nr:glycosyltransferase [Terriglobales bacterium]